MQSLLSNPAAVGDRDALDEILRTLRQICLLHELRPTDEAIASQERRVGQLVAAYRTTNGPASLSDERIDALRLAEQERVAAAATLSEVLAPLLAECLQVPLPGAATVRRGKSPRRETPAPARPLPAESPAIVDLIDGMLALEGRPAAPRRRRA